MTQGWLNCCVNWLQRENSNFISYIFHTHSKESQKDITQIVDSTHHWHIRWEINSLPCCTWMQHVDSSLPWSQIFTSLPFVAEETESREAKLTFSCHTGQLGLKPKSIKCKIPCTFSLTHNVSKKNLLLYVNKVIMVRMMKLNVILVIFLQLN